MLINIIACFLLILSLILTECGNLYKLVASILLLLNILVIICKKEDDK